MRKRRRRRRHDLDERRKGSVYILMEKNDEIEAASTHTENTPQPALHKENGGDEAKSSQETRKEGERNVCTKLTSNHTRL